MKIPIYQPWLGGNEKKYVNECLDTNWISSKGKFIQKFEDKFAEYLGIKYATGICNGTTALHLALETLGICEGDEVIVPTFTYIASVSSILYTGATPVFVDSLASTWQMDPTDIRRKITSKTKAIMPVHLYGHPCEMDEICKIADEYKLFIIEDCAEAFGSKYKNKYVGTFGSISAFSFYGNKTITTGEGGMLITNDFSLYNKAYHLKMHGVSKDKEYWHDVIGYNYRMTNICAAIGLSQLENVEERIKLKRELAEKYNKFLSGLPVTPHKEAQNVFHTYWMYSILVENEKMRNSLRDFLKQEGIETRPTFYPVHTMPMFSKQYHKFPVAEDIAIRGINLPSWPNMPNESIEYICTKIKEFYSQ
ncbi:MAG: DegT/DnrJ/EryC1/StrS aminotransferase family protein [Ignavibacteriae bacterium]|nr:DegT/DnrJ/EryC1/StrS aminotransferase family protein [Ignavibacteriota bacterium]